MLPFLLRAGLMGLLLVAVACCPRITSSVTSEVKDSVYVKETLRVDTFKLPGDTVTLKVPIECDPVTLKPKPKKTSKKSTRGSAALEIDKHGNANVTSVCDDLFKLIEVRDKEIYRLRQEKKEESKAVEVYKTRAIDIFCRWVTGLLFLILTGYAAFKYFKTSLPWTRILKN